MAETYLVKLGGSVITYKSKYRTMRVKVANRLVSELSTYLKKDKRLILVHGAGSFGHILAEEQELHKGIKDRSNARYACIVQRDVRDLSLRLMNMMVNKGLRPTSVAPANVLVKLKTEVRGLRDLKMNYEPYECALEQGLCPVTFGDVVPDRTAGVSIISGDDLMLALARHFNATGAIFVTDVDGILKRVPKRKDSDLIQRIDSTAGVKNDIWVESGIKDVTGSMKRKLDLCLKIAKAGTPVSVVNGLRKGRLSKALAGKTVGTRIE